MMGTTIYLITAPVSVIAFATILITISYTFLLTFFKQASERLILAYPHYKHNFVKVFDEII